MRSTHSADRVPGCLLHHSFPELARREITQRAMGVDVVVMLEPRIELAQHASRIGFRADQRVIPFEQFDKGFGHTIRLGLSIGVVRGTKPISRAKARVSPAV